MLLLALLLALTVPAAAQTAPSAAFSLASTTNISSGLSGFRVALQHPTQPDLLLGIAQPGYATFGTTYATAVLLNITTGSVAASAPLPTGFIFQPSGGTFTPDGSQSFWIARTSSGTGYVVIQIATTTLAAVQAPADVNLILVGNIRTCTSLTADNRFLYGFSTGYFYSFDFTAGWLPAASAAATTLSYICGGIVDPATGNAWMSAASSMSSYPQVVQVAPPPSLAMLSSTSLTGAYSTSYPPQVLAVDGVSVYVTTYCGSSVRRVYGVSKAAPSSPPAQSAGFSGSTTPVTGGRIVASGATLLLAAPGGIAAVALPGLATASSCVAWASSATSSTVYAAGAGFSADGGVVFTLRYSDSLGIAETWASPLSRIAACGLRTAVVQLDSGTAPITLLAIDPQRRVGYAAIAPSSTSSGMSNGPTLAAFSLSGTSASALSRLSLWPPSVPASSGTAYRVTAMTIDVAGGRLYAASTGSASATTNVPRLYQVGMAAGPANLSMALLQAAAVPLLPATMVITALVVDAAGGFLYLGGSGVSSGDAYGHVYQVAVSNLSSCCNLHILAPRAAGISGAFLVGGAAYWAGSDLTVSPSNATLSAMSLAAPTGAMRTTSLGINAFGGSRQLLVAVEPWAGATAYAVLPVTSSPTYYGPGFIATVDLATMSVVARTGLTWTGSYYDPMTVVLAGGVAGGGSAAGNLLMLTRDDYGYYYLANWSPSAGGRPTTSPLPTSQPFSYAVVDSATSCLQVVGSNSGFPVVYQYCLPGGPTAAPSPSPTASATGSALSTPTATESNGGTLASTATAAASASAWPSLPPFPSESVTPTISITASPSSSPGSPPSASPMPPPTAPPSAVPLPTGWPGSSSVTAAPPAGGGGSGSVGAAVGGSVAGFAAGLVAAAVNASIPPARPYWPPPLPALVITEL
jgi:hypothetical protein